MKGRGRFAPPSFFAYEILSRRRGAVRHLCDRRICRNHDDQVDGGEKGYDTQERHDEIDRYDFSCQKNNWREDGFFLREKQIGEKQSGGKGPGSHMANTSAESDAGAI
jgi:hypothetical protein